MCTYSKFKIDFVFMKFQLNIKFLSQFDSSNVDPGRGARGICPTIRNVIFFIYYKINNSYDLKSVN